MSEREYHDLDGNPVSLDRLVRKEPEWAVNQIRHRDVLRKRLMKIDKQHTLQPTATAEIATLKKELDSYHGMSELVDHMREREAKAEEQLALEKEQRDFERHKVERLNDKLTMSRLNNDMLLEVIQKNLPHKDGESDVDCVIVWRSCGID